MEMLVWVPFEKLWPYALVVATTDCDEDQYPLLLLALMNPKSPPANATFWVPVQRTVGAAGVAGAGLRE